MSTTKECKILKGSLKTQKKKKEGSHSPAVTSGLNLGFHY